MTNLVAKAGVTLLLSTCFLVEGLRNQSTKKFPTRQRRLNDVDTSCSVDISKVASGGLEYQVKVGSFPSDQTGLFDFEIVDEPWKGIYRGFCLGK
jgi:hypothetical protein